MERGEIWWANLPDETGGRRPVVLISANAFNRSAIRTVIIAVMTSKVDRAAAPGNVLVTAEQSGLRKASVVNVSQIFTVERETLTEKAGNMPNRVMAKVDEGIRKVLGL